MRQRGWRKDWRCNWAGSSIPGSRELDEQVDKRLVRTFVQTIEGILSFRDRAGGLLLSELGSLLLGAEHAPAGTKRLSNLVRSSKAARLTHVNPGFYRPPPKPVFVPGLHWLAVVLVGVSAQAGPPVLAAMRWWSTRGGPGQLQTRRGTAPAALPPAGVGTASAARLRPRLRQSSVVGRALRL